VEQGLRFQNVTSQTIWVSMAYYDQSCGAANQYFRKQGWWQIPSMGSVTIFTQGLTSLNRYAYFEAEFAPDNMVPGWCGTGNAWTELTDNGYDQCFLDQTGCNRWVDFKELDFGGLLGLIVQLGPNAGEVTLLPTTSYSCNLGLIEEYQQESEWCWAATTVSINRYYDPASTWTQCSFVNDAFSLTTCCQDGSSSACNQPWYGDRALKITGNYVSTGNGKPSFSTVVNEINAGRPISVAIYWFGTGGHNPAVDGYDDENAAAPTIDVQDPIYGPSTQDFNTFPSSYNGGATWGYSFFTD
jgi:uncharacterized membrane protein